MAIWAFTGLPGSGKSLHMASVIRSTLGRRPAPVIGNFALAETAPVRHPELYTYREDAEITPDLLFDFAESWWAKHPDEWHEGALLLALDEVQLVLNSRSWQDTSRGSWLKFFSQHRKLGYTCILCTQALGMLDKQIRDNIEFETYHRNLKTFGVFGALLSVLVPGGLFVQITDYPQTRQHLYTEFHRGRKKDFLMYDTRRVFGGTAQPGGTGGR